MKRIFSLLSVAALIFTFVISAPVYAEDEFKITEAAGGFESAYVKWLPLSGAEGYNVYYASADDSAYIKIDSQLIRAYADYMRADILGLKEGSYNIKVVPLSSGAEQTALAVSETVTVKAYTREGFAFSAKSPYGTTNGGYNSDGTIKANAEVVYVTDWNKNTVTIGGDSSKGVGLSGILNARDKEKSKTPLVVRFIGKVTMPNNVENYMLKVSNTQNVTLEGVGEDATLHGWGLTFKRACNIEVRNLGIMWYGGVGGDGDSLSLDTENKNLWLHNNDFFYGAPGKDSDQAKGDGSIDLKAGSDYITISYNHFWDSGKTCVSGGVFEAKNPDDEKSKIFITYHHNWFDHSDSRHPRCVAGSTHVYNNYYDGVAKYGIGAAVKSSVFAESNYFRNCPRPMLIATQGSDCYSAASGTYTDKGTLSGQDGGMIKEFGNVIIGARRYYTYQTTPDLGEFDAYTVNTRDEKVPETVTAKTGGAVYNNFDTDADMYSYAPDTAEEAVEKIKAYAGRAGGGDFKYIFDNAVQDSNSNIIPELQKAIINYTSKLVSVPAIPYVEPDPSESETPISSAAPSAAPVVPVGSEVQHNFTTQGKASDFFVFNDTCSIKSDKDTIQYGDETLTKCLEIGSSTSFSFRAPKNGRCTFVMSPSKSVSANVNNERVTGDVSSGILTFDIEAGKDYVITKGGGSAYLFYIAVSFDGGGVQDYEIIDAVFNADNKLSVTLKHNAEERQEAVLIAAAYDESGCLSRVKCFEINDTEVSGLDFDRRADESVRLFIWNSLDAAQPLSEMKTVE